MHSSYKRTTEALFELAGVKINGDNPWDIRVHNEDFYRRIMTEVELGLGESFMDGWWDCEKLDLICRKLYLEPGMRILDIGCGWGPFGKYAAEKFKVEVVGITVSKQQVELGRKLCHGLPVEFRLLDYRELDEKFDRIFSIGMFEHVCYQNYRTFFRVAARCLRDDGLFLLHTIGNYRSVKTTDLWTKKYIFPVWMIPSIAQVGKAIEKLFMMEDWHNFGLDYDKTLMA